MTGSRRVARLGRAALVMLVSLCLVTSAVGPGLAAEDGAAVSDSAPSGPADTAYVTADGDVVLVYEESRSANGNGTGRFSANVEEGLVYGLLTEPVAEPPDVTGEFTARAEPERLTADGDLSAPRPEMVESFDLSASGQTTAEESASEFDLSARFVNVTGPAAIVSSATTQGSVATGPDRLQANGSLEVETAMPLDQDSRLAMTLTESDDAYELTVERRETLRPMDVGNWSDRSQAAETIREQFVGNESDDGSVDVAIDRYDLTERDDGSAQLDTRFTVTYAGVDEELTEAIAGSIALSTASPTDVSSTSVGDDGEPSAVEPDDEARELAEELLATDVREAGFEFVASGGTYSGNFALDVGGYEDFALAYYDYLESTDGQAASTFGADEARTQFEAQSAADMTTTFIWSGDLTKPASDEVELDLTFETQSDNWADYVSELEDRDVPVHDSEYELSGTTDGDRIEVDGSMELSGDRLFATTFADVEETVAGMEPTTVRERSDSDPGESDDGLLDVEGPEVNLTEALDSLARSEPEQAKLSGSFDEDGFRLEFGAEFGNLSALREDLAAQAGAPALGNVTEVVSETEGDTERTYVRVSGATSEDASESDVHALPAVSEDTTVQTADEHDGDLPTMDVEGATSFLAANSSGGVVPGFGAALALVALVAAVLGGAVLGRRRS